MKTLSYNSINVGGNVKISTQRGKRRIKQQVIKNSATQQLFTFLAKALNGTIQSNTIPSYIKIITTNGSNKHEVIVSKQQTEVNSPQITFGFYINYGQLGNSSMAGTWSITQLQLLDNTPQKNKLATVDLTLDPITDINPNNVNYSLLIDWTIGFQDATTAQVSQA